ncbi:hypothetical protein ACWDYH_31030 [Nocardia goodfellowii]
MTVSPSWNQAVGEMAADAVATFDRPDPVGESLCGGQHFGVAGVGGGVSAGGKDATGRVDEVSNYPLTVPRQLVKSLSAKCTDLPMCGCALV